MDSSFLSSIGKDLWLCLWSFGKHQWRGLIVGVLLCGVSLGWLFGGDVINYRQKGALVGVYELTKGGEPKTVARNELRIGFTTTNYVEELPGGNVAWDTVVFPSFVFDLYPERENIDRAKVGDQLGIDGKYYYYTLEFKELVIGAEDTTAVWKVWRREYPQTPRP